VFSPNGALIASTTDPYVMSESYAGVWDMSNCLQLCSLPTDRMYLSVGLSAFGNRLVTTSLSGLNHFATEVWDAESGKHLLDLDGSNARLAQFTRDCSKIVTSEHNSGLAVWDASTGKRIRSIGLPQASRAFLLSPDGTRCLAKWAERSNWDPDNGASLVDLVTGKELIRFDGNAGGIVGFSYDGKTVSAFETPDKTSAVIWDTATCKRLRRIELAER
jgi:WD40 repeat protein